MAGGTLLASAGQRHNGDDRDRHQRRPSHEAPADQVMQRPCR